MKNGCIESFGTHDYLMKNSKYYYEMFESQKGLYYEKAVLWAVENGIATGTSSTTFSPDAKCTRGQIVTFLWRFNGKPAVSTENPFADVTYGEYYYEPVLWAVQAKITTGTSSTTFGPNANCTRGQIVTFLYRNAQQ